MRQRHLYLGLVVEHFRLGLDSTQTNDIPKIDGLFLLMKIEDLWTKLLPKHLRYFWKHGIIILPHMVQKSGIFAARSHREETTISKHGLAARKTCASGNRVIWSRDLRREKDLDEKSQQKNLELITTWSFSMILQKTPRWEDNYVAYYLLLFQPWKSWWSWMQSGIAHQQHNLSQLCEDSNDTCISIEWRWIVCHQEFQCLLWHEPGTFQAHHSTCAAFENGFGCDVVFREGLWLLSRQVCFKDSYIHIIHLSEPQTKPFVADGFP